MRIINVTAIHTIKRRLASGAIKEYHYHRKTRDRLPDEPIAAVLKAAELSTRPPATSTTPGTLGALIIAYKDSAEYRQLAEKTRRDYARYLDVLREMWGAFYAKDFGRRHVKMLKEKFQDTPRTANYIIQIFRLLMTLAIDEELRETNPASRPRMLRTGVGHRPWEEDEIAAFRNRWPVGGRERTAFELTLNSGQRGEDVVVMGRRHYRAGWLSVKQLKTDARVEVPVSVELKATLEPFLRSHANLSLLVNESGTPFKVDNFRHFMRAAYDAAGLPRTCTTHGLRYTQATVLGELGCDPQTIADITGHETVQMVRKYTAQRRRTRLAIDRLDRARLHPNGEADGHNFYTE